MCRRAGYYAWCKRPTSQHSRKDAELADQIKIVFQANRGVHGSPRVHAELQAQGITCARKRVARLMRDQGLCAKRPRHRTVTTQSDPEAQAAPNLLQRDFSSEQPNTKWVADTTYIWTAEGWLYLAVVLDLFSRMAGGLVHGRDSGCHASRPGTPDGGHPASSTARIASSL